MAEKNFHFYSHEIAKLAFPILGVRIFYMGVVFLGMIFIAHLGPYELAAGALVTALINTITVIAMSPLLAISVIISRYCGENRTTAIGVVIRQGWLIALLMGLGGGVLLWYLPDLLQYLGQPAPIIPLVSSYLHGFAWGLVPSFLLAACHQLFFPIRKGMLVLYLSIINFILTVLLGIGLIFGLGGLPQLGMAGWAYSIAIVNWFLFILVAAYLLWSKSFSQYEIFHFKGRFDYERFKLFFKISFPITMQFSSELLAFSAINIMVGWLGLQALSVQQIVIQCSTFVLMIPMGIGQACTILIGYAIGHQEADQVRRICLTGVIWVLICMLVIAGGYWLLPHWIIALYVPLTAANQAVIHLAVIILALVAFSQIADSVRNVVISALRGMHDVWGPMWLNMAILWLIGLPCAYLFSFIFKMGLLGLNLGYLLAFFGGAIVMLVRFRAKTR